MSKWGAHISLGRRDGFGAALLQCANEKSPIPLLFAFDQDVWPDVQSNSPTTIVIFRATINGNDNPPAIYQGNAVTAANDWYALCKPKWQQHRAHYYAAWNERNPNSAAQDAWIDLFDLRMMQLAEADGFKLALHGDSMGTPDYPQWMHYQPSLAYAATRGHVLSLHEPCTGGPDLALRYRKVHNLIEPFAPGLKIAISECYAGDIWQTGYEAYDIETMKDPYMLGFAAYQLGGAENWYQKIPQWAAYVSTHPTPAQPADATEREFDHWLDLDSNSVIGAVNPLTITIDRNRTIQAVTRQKTTPPVSYTVTVAADYGTVTGGGSYAAGSAATLEWKA